MVFTEDIECRAILGIITTKVPSNIVLASIKRAVAIGDICSYVCINSSKVEVLKKWESVRNQFGIELVKRDDFFSAGAARNAILKELYDSLNGKNINVWLIDDDMLPSFKSLENLKNIDLNQTLIPIRREIINGEKISLDLRLNRRNLGRIRYRSGGSLIFKYTKELAMFPEEVFCEEETLWNLKNNSRLGVYPELTDLFSFIHFGENNNNKKLLRLIRMPYISLLYHIVLLVFKGRPDGLGYLLLQMLKIK